MRFVQHPSPRLPLECRCRDSRGSSNAASVPASPSVPRPSRRATWSTSGGKYSTNPFRDAPLMCDRADVMAKKLLSPIRVLPSTLGTGQHLTLQCSIGCSAMPTPQGADQMIVKRHWFLGSLRLTLPDDLLHDRSSNPELFGLEIDVLP